MARTTADTANILTDFYSETFAKEYCEKFRITWSQLRLLSGTSKLTKNYLQNINEYLCRMGYTLIPMNDFLILAQVSEFADFRAVPYRIIERFMPDDEDDLELDDDVEIEDTDEEV